MTKNALPLPLAKIILRLMPPLVLARGVEVIVRRMEKRHPKLFKNIARLPPAIIHLNPTDLPHSFVLHTGPDPDFSLFVKSSSSFQKKPDASVSGSLQSLIDMLEGRTDGDTLFFSRDIRIEGDTETIVGLRNTLDREEIDLYAEILSLCGPFAGPVAKMVEMAFSIRHSAFRGDC